MVVKIWILWTTMTAMSARLVIFPAWENEMGRVDLIERFAVVWTCGGLI